ncbi:MAG TPA: phage antirepressor protein [Clostridiales bacterium]|nr:phage antirepressor protein [Clostridiales bacterium]
MHLINKIFNNETIRTIWDKEEEKYYISIIDIVGILSNSSEPRKYWNWLKNKIKKEEQFEVSSITRQLKLKAQDGKYRMTDVCDIEGMFRIIESIPSKNAEPIKQWLAHLGKEKIDETFDPSIALQRAIDLYRTKGYEEEWIAKRMKSIQERKKLTDVWKENGIENNIEYAILTNEIYKEWSGMTAKEYKQYKGLRKENLRDNMDNIELILTDLSEEATKRLATKQKPNGLKENIKVAKMGGHAAKVARDDIEKNLGESVVTKTNKLNYKYIEEEEKQAELKEKNKKKLK